MFRTLGNTWKIVKISWHVLLRDKELLWFPVMSGVGVLIVIAIAAGVFGAMGTFERLGSSGEAQTQTGDVIVGLLALFGAFFMINYFNAALIGAARHRLKGGDPDLATGFSAVNRHLPAVLGWTAISVVIFLILQYLRNRQSGFLYDLIVGIIGAVWAYMTFFVIPVLIVEGVGPIEAIKRSAGYFRRTWGEQLASNFGFGILRIGVGIIAAVPIALIASISPIAAIIIGVPVIGIGFAAVQALEGIFKAALYEYVAEGVQPQFFDRETLAGAYSQGGGSGYRPYRPRL